MPILVVLRFLVAAVLSIAALILLFQMFLAEKSTQQVFANYFEWAKFAGLIFLAVGAALTFFDKEDTVVTDFNSESNP